MADFCKQCSIELFGEDFGELAGMTTKEETENGLGMSVLCEGCVNAWVDHEGTCKANNCLKKHGVNHGQ